MISLYMQAPMILFPGLVLSLLIIAVVACVIKSAKDRRDRAKMPPEEENLPFPDEDGDLLPDPVTIGARLIDKDCGVSYSGTIMMSHEDKYAVLFVCDDASEKTFYVDGETYASLHEDDYGTLVYVGDTFLGFDLGEN